MNPVASIGKTLVAAGLALAALGLLFLLASRIPHLGRLPGDISVERPGFRFYFPLTTSLLISVVLSVVIALLRRRH